MKKYKRQRVYSKTNGMRHRMIYLLGDKGFIRAGRRMVMVEWERRDIWRVI